MMKLVIYVIIIVVLALGGWMMLRDGSDGGVEVVSGTTESVPVVTSTRPPVDIQ